MITVLTVADRERQAELDAVAAHVPSLEVLHSTDVEETLDRLARNRRIDAVLLLVAPERATEIAEVILEEDPAGPPMYAPASAGKVSGVHPLPGEDAGEILAALARELSG